MFGEAIACLIESCVSCDCFSARQMRLGGFLKFKITNAKLIYQTTWSRNNNYTFTQRTGTGHIFRERRNFPITSHTVINIYLFHFEIVNHHTNYICEVLYLISRFTNIPKHPLSFYRHWHICNTTHKKYILGTHLRTFIWLIQKSLSCD